MGFRDIPGSEGWLDVIPVNEGWSGDEKYRVVGENGRQLLLRISPAEKAARRRGEFETLRRVNAQVAANIPQAVDCGTCDGGVYTLLSWVPGRPVEEVLPELTADQQADLGAQAGRIARMLHDVPAPEGVEDWQARFSRKMARKVEQYRACPIKIPECADFAAYVRENGRLIEGRANRFQHGDLHVGNMVVDSGLQLGLVDFDRMDWGDPWEEFNRITWSAQCSPVFASAMVREYFGGEAPEAFWRLLALYMASNQLSCIPWAMPFGQEQVDVMIEQCRQVRAWYPGAYGDGAPVWFR